MIQNSNRQYLNFAIVTLSLILSSIPIFYNLGEASIYMWDEAIYAINSLEMVINNDYWVYRINGEPTLYNTKPPLVLWLQAMFIHLIGPNEWAIRLPSALFSVATYTTLLLFSKKSLKDIKIGVFAILILATSQGFIRPHVARSGDLDSILVFWITFYSLTLFHIFLDDCKNLKKYIYLISIAVLLGYFTKSTAVFLPLPGLLLAGLVQGKIWQILKSKHFYISIAGFIVIVLAYYWWVDQSNEGFIEKVWTSEYSRLYKDIMPYHNQPFTFYLSNFVNRSFFTPYIYIFPIIIFYSIFFKSSQNRRFLFLGIIFCLFYLFVISYPSIKLEWYDAPLYPFFALIIGCFFKDIISRISSNPIVQNMLSIGIVILYLFPIQNITQWALELSPTHEFEFEGIAIKEMQKQYPEEKDYVVLFPATHPRHRDQAMFYVRSLNQWDNYNLSIEPGLDSINILKPLNVLACRSIDFNGLDIVEEIQLSNECRYLKVRPFPKK